MAMAYGLSIVLNAGFWLAYGRALRQSSAAPTIRPDKTARLKPLVLAQFQPLPPLPP